jgi:hypothetical protein
MTAEQPAADGPPADRSGDGQSGDTPGSDPSGKQPAGSDARGTDEQPAGNDADSPVRRTERPHQAPPSETFDWRGWVLVGVVVVAFLVVPAALLYLPRAQALVASLGLTLRDAYLVLPLVPAFLLGATAVWAALRSRSD